MFLGDCKTKSCRLEDFAYKMPATLMLFCSANKQEFFKAWQCAFGWGVSFPIWCKNILEFIMAKSSG